MLRASGASEEALAVAEHALGVASRDLGAPGQAVQHLEAAVAHARTAGATKREGEARISLALAYMQTGESRRALGELRRAAAVSGVDRGRLYANRALIMQRLGREKEALSDYDAALFESRSAHNTWVEARILSNLGVLRAYGGDFAQALADLDRARAIHIELGAEVMAAEVLHNTGFALARQGDLPGALARYDEAAAAFAQLGLARTEPLVDRCELLIEMGLLPEARAAARAAIAGCETMGRSVDAAEARLMLARVHLLQDDVATAAELAAEAHRELSHQRRDPWALLASFVELQARAGGNTPNHGADGLAREARRMARRLADVGWSVAALESLVLSARASLSAGKLSAARERLEEAAEARTRGPATLRVRAWHAEAMLRAARGDTPAALAALRAGLRIVDRQRDSLGATELRVRSKAVATELAELGVTLALATGRPAAVFDWIERWRANMLAPGRLRPVEDPELARLLGLLRETAARALSKMLAGADASAELRRQETLEAKVRRRGIDAPGAVAGSAETDARTPRLTLGAAQAALGPGRVLVEMLLSDGVLWAVVATGEPRAAALVRLAAVAEVERERASQLFALGRLARRRGAQAALEAASLELRESSRRLDELLMGPLVGWLGERDPVVVPTGELHSLAWSLLASLDARRTVLVPSARLWLEREPGQTRDPRTHRSVALVAGPGVQNAVSEVTALHDRLYPYAATLIGQEATAARVLTEIEGKALVHMAVHGEFRRDSPQFSALILADGPLTVFDLEAIQRPPETIVLSACDLALMHAPAGGEPMGPVAALLGIGARSVVASVAPVPDDGASTFVQSLHERLAAGSGPAAGLAAALELHSLHRLDTAAVVAGGAEVAAAVAGAGFVCFGAG